MKHNRTSTVYDEPVHLHARDGACDQIDVGHNSDLKAQTARATAIHGSRARGDAGDSTDAVQKGTMASMTVLVLHGAGVNAR